MARRSRACKCAGRPAAPRQRHRLEQSAEEALTDEQIRALLRRLFQEIADVSADMDRRAEARQALAEVIEHIELDPASLTARVHMAVHTGVNLASPRGFEPLYSP